MYRDVSAIQDTGRRENKRSIADCADQPATAKQPADMLQELAVRIIADPQGGDNQREIRVGRGVQIVFRLDLKPVAGADGGSV